VSPIVGIIANPVSARDIRRVIANAASLQITDRANIVLRVLACLRAGGVRDVLMMPENGGIGGHVERALARAQVRGEEQFPTVRHVPIRVTGTVSDTHRAAAAMCQAGVAAIVVLGGDGTHRAVVAHCGSTPIAGISTGTNNAFPDHREPTITGMATALVVTGRVPADVAFFEHKRIEVSINGGATREIALVDVALVTEPHLGARALWRPETFRELFVTFADPEVIGMSSVAGLLQPVTRRESGGLAVQMRPLQESRYVVRAPIAPGLISPVGVASWRRMPAGVGLAPQLGAGSIALDGERELSFSERDHVEIILRDRAFRSVNIAGTMDYAARAGLFHGPIEQLNAAE
jgi:predicted polyphosphate/ATP-dependent NAD kinase